MIYCLYTFLIVYCIFERIFTKNGRRKISFKNPEQRQKRKRSTETRNTLYKQKDISPITLWLLFILGLLLAKTAMTPFVLKQDKSPQSPLQSLWESIIMRTMWGSHHLIKARGDWCSKNKNLPQRTMCRASACMFTTATWLIQTILWSCTALNWQ